MLRLTLLALVALSAATPAAAEPSELVVASAVSLREPLEQIADSFEAGHPKVALGVALGASNVLAAQVRAGAPIDVLISADERIAARLVETRFCEGLVVLAQNQLVVVQRADLTPRLESPEDLSDSRVERIAVPEYGVPVGTYARTWLESRGLLDSMRDRIVATEHARATLAAVDRRHADAAVVYATDARLARSAMLAFAVPRNEHPPIVYVACRVSASSQPRLADSFLQTLREEPAREALLRAGFSVPIP